MQKKVFSSPIYFLPTCSFPRSSNTERIQSPQIYALQSNIAQPDQKLEVDSWGRDGQDGVTGIEERTPVQIQRPVNDHAAIQS